MTKFLGSIALAAIAFAVVPDVLKADDGGALCPRGNATLHGTYMSRGEGTIVGVGPIAAVGWIAYDGKGNFVNPFTVSVNGMISTGVETGTYTVNSDCTGSVSASDGNHYNFLLAPDGSTFHWIKTDPNSVVTGTATRMKPANGFME